MKLLASFAFSSLLLTSAPLRADDAAAPADPISFDKTFVTRHAGTFNGGHVDYTATVTSTVLTTDEGRPGVNFVSTDYVRNGVADASRRPVIFGWAGGPSGPSTAYHMRILGPRQIFNGALRDNPDSLIDIADIVLIDPAETGFSRILPDGDRRYYYSVGGDAAAIVQFMDRWLVAHGRPNAPRYVMGGSYGSVRSIRVAYEAMRSGKPVDGIIMTANSAMIQQMSTIVGGPAALPTRTMTALYHGKVDRNGRSDAQIADEAYRFAMHEYLPALATVQDMPPAERKAIAQKLAAMTGLSADRIDANDLAIDDAMFRNDLLKSEGKVLSEPTDGRFTSPVDDPRPAPDGNIALFKTYLARELGVTYPMDLYATQAPGAGKEWDFRGPSGEPRNNWAGLLQEIFKVNPAMKVYSANGYYDDLSFFGQARYFFSSTRLPRDRIVIREYPGSHALYSDPAIGSAILKDIRQLITSP